MSFQLDFFGMAVARAKEENPRKETCDPPELKPPLATNILPRTLTLAHRVSDEALATLSFPEQDHGEGFAARFPHWPYEKRVYEIDGRILTTVVGLMKADDQIRHHVTQSGIIYTFPTAEARFLLLSKIGMVGKEWIGKDWAGKETTQMGVRQSIQVFRLVEAFATGETLPSRSGFENEYQFGKVVQQFVRRWYKESWDFRSQTLNCLRRACDVEIFRPQLGKVRDQIGSFNRVLRYKREVKFNRNADELGTFYHDCAERRSGSTQEMLKKEAETVLVERDELNIIMEI